jgi:hypothetical protein
MKRFIIAFTGLIALIVPAGVASADDSTQQALDSLSKRWIQAIKAEDVSGYAG